MKKHHSVQSVFFLLAMTLSACAQFKTVGSSVLSSTGVVSYDQANSLMDAGENVYQASRGLSPDEEYYLGRSVSAMVLGKYPSLGNAALSQYVSKVGSTLARVSDLPETYGGYHFGVLNSDEINALSTPGGFIFITKGFLKILPDEDALAAVLAHEIGHIVARDGLKAISSSHITKAVAILGRQAASDAVAQHGGVVASELTNAFSGSVEDVFTTLVTNGYSRSQEYAADKYSVELLKRAGYNTYAAVTVMEKLESIKSKGGIFETHPAPADRKSEIITLVAKEPPSTEAQKGRMKRFLSALGSARISPVA